MWPQKHNKLSVQAPWVFVGLDPAMELGSVHHLAAPVCHWWGGSDVD